MTPEDIDRWRPEQIDDVFAACAKQQQTCAELSESLNNPEVMESWGGAAADAARAAADKHRTDLDDMAPRSTTSRLRSTKPERMSSK